MPIGFLYILVNPSMPGLLKIGKTTRFPDERAAELSADTGLPTRFMVAYDWSVSDCDAAETQVHDLLKSFRINSDREFFALPLKQAIKSIEPLCEFFRVDGSSLNTGRSRPGFFTCTAAIVCDKCGRQYTVTLRRFEAAVTCPRCRHRQEYDVEWADTAAP
jgi:hypothetical protein